MAMKYALTLTSTDVFVQLIRPGGSDWTVDNGGILAGWIVDNCG